MRVEDYISPLDFVFSPVYQHVFKHKPLEWYFTKDPAFLAYEILDEFMEYKAFKSQKDNAERMYNDLKSYLIKIIMERKEKEKQLTLLTVAPGEPLQDKVLLEIRNKFPRAFIRKFKKSQNRYGEVQIIMDLSLLYPVHSLVETLDFSDSDSENNPLMFI